MPVSVKAQLFWGASFNAFLMPTDKFADLYLGATLDMGFSVKKNNYLLLNIGYCYGLSSGKEVGSFTYSTMDKYGNISAFDNGIIKRQSSIIPVQVNWNWKIPLSDKISFHIGPTVGMNVLSTYNTYYVGNTEWAPNYDLGEKDKPGNYKFNALFGAGGNVILMFSKFSIGYKYLWQGSKSFDDVTYKGSMHQITVSFTYDD